MTRGGTVAIAGEYAAGTMVVTEEICRRVNKEPGGLSIFEVDAAGRVTRARFGENYTELIESWEDR